ncbi:MAG: DUF58 domain-containing protein [Oscillospiraceae bacterium]|nr:DUF58 domain-containing protein [Oscillospiraceae bacterium]MBQ6403765.1 DUF58 domain-containing protein [Oscillospiraceae bacterium]
MWKRRLVWLLLILAAAALYLFENNGATLAVLLIVLLVPLFGILLAAFGTKNATADIVLPERCACGDEIHGALHSQTRGEAVLLVENHHTGESAELSLPLMRSETPFTVQAACCGVVRARVKHLLARDLFGLAAWKCPVTSEAATVVLPALFQPEVVLTESSFAMLDSEEYSAVKPGFDPSETFGIREYRPGDNIKTIHWKASQKTGETMIRELSLPVEHQVLLRYENPALGQAAPETIHSMTTLLLSLSAVLTEQGVVHDLGWRGALWQIDSEDARLAAMDALLSLPPETAPALPARIGGSYAHVATISAEPVLGLADLYNGSHVTVLKPGAGAEGMQPDGTVQICYESLEQLGRVEL